MFTLFNRYTKKYLDHPSTGRWAVPTIEEAEEMKQACINMFKEINYDFMSEYIEIAELPKIENGNLNNGQ